MAQHDPKKAEPAHGGGHHAESHAQDKGLRSIEHIQADLEDVKAQLAEAIPEIESDSAKQRRQLERIQAAKVKWGLTHEPDDPFDPSQFEPPMVPLKVDAKKQQEFHGLHYRIARLEAELVGAVKAAITG
jgi:hypothetical protein